MDEKLHQRPLQVNILLGASSMLGLAFLGLAVFLMSLGGVRASMVLGLVPAGMMLAGAYGFANGTDWGKHTLASGLIAGASGAGFVLLFGLLVGRTETAMWGNIVSGTLMVVLISLAFMLRTSTVQTYYTDRRMSHLDAEDSLDNREPGIVFEFESEQQEEPDEAQRRIPENESYR